MTAPPPGLVCVRCKERLATHRYSEWGSPLDFTYGNFQWWCEHCVVDRSIEYVTQQTARLPDLIKRRMELDT